jgi:hypothetical protein
MVSLFPRRGKRFLGRRLEGTTHWNRPAGPTLRDLFRFPLCPRYIGGVEVNLWVYIVLRTLVKYGGTATAVFIACLLIAIFFGTLGNSKAEKNDKVLSFLRLALWTAFVAQMLISPQIDTPGSWLDYFKPTLVTITSDGGSIPFYSDDFGTTLVHIHRAVILLVHLPAIVLVSRTLKKMRKASKPVEHFDTINR